MTEPLHVIAGTSDEESREHIGFQYVWPVKITERLLENEEAAVLNVSPPFTTSYNGVQFTWALRLGDECFIPTSNTDTSRQVLLHLYFKDGPCDEAPVEEVRASICDANGVEIMKEHYLGPKEFNKGSGWPLNIEDSARRQQFSDLIKKRIDGHLTILCSVKMKKTLYEPFSYLPDVETSQRIEKHCERFIEQVRNKTLQVPNVDMLGDAVHRALKQWLDHHDHIHSHSKSQKMDKYSMHRLIFLYGCDLVERECVDERGEQNEKFVKLVRSTFAHVYFNQILMKEVEYMEDFLSLLEGIIQAQIAPLKREVERFICQEVMADIAASKRASRKSSALVSDEFQMAGTDCCCLLRGAIRHHPESQTVGRASPHHVFHQFQDTSDSEFTKKMVLLAEKHSLDVLKMVATGVLVDQIVAHSNPPAELVSISHDLKKFASEIKEITSEETVVGSVVEDLQALARRVRRVSLSHSPSVSSQGSSPSQTPHDSVSLSPAVSDQRPFDGTGHSRFKRVELASP